MDRETYEEYLGNLVETMLHDMDNSSSANVMMIKHYNALDITQSDIDNIAGERKDVRFLYHSYETGDIVTAFEPFLDWVKDGCYELYGDDVEAFFDAADIYLLHRPVYKSYFETGICRRKESILVNEIDFETEKFQNEMVSMVKLIAKDRPLVMVLNKIQFAGSSTIKLLNRLMEESVAGNIFILLTYNEMFGEKEYFKDDWRQLISALDSSDSIIEWAFSPVKELHENKGHFEFAYEKVTEYIDKLTNLYEMLALDQADYYLNIIYRKIEVEDVDISMEHRFKFLEIYAYVTMNLDKMSDALLYCNNMRFILEENNDYEMNYTYNYLKAQISMYSTQKDNADVYVQRCKKLCEQINNPFLTFKTKLLALMNEFSGWRNLWLLTEDKYVEPEIIDECIRYEHYNHLAHIYVYAFDNDPSKYVSTETVDKNIENYNRGIAIANRIGNDRFIIDAYKKSVMTASTNGYFDVSNHFYSKCYEVVSRIGNEFEEANIYNGMGYNCSTMEKHSKASEYFNKALLIFTKLKDVNYISETLYNMAINAILAEEYTYADMFLTTCLKICRLIKSDGLRVCNLSKLYGLKALCNAEMNILYSCRINYQYLERYLGHIIELEDKEENGSRLWEDDLILYYLIGAILSAKERRYETAYKQLRRADKYMRRASGSGFLFIVPYTIIYTDVCKALGKHDEAEQYFESAIEFCASKGYTQKKNKIKSYRDGQSYIPRRCDVSVKGVTMDEILDLATSSIIHNDYIVQRSKMDFLSIWQKITNNDEDTADKIIHNSITTLKNSYSIDELIFIRIEDGVPVIKYNDTNYEMGEEQVEYLIKYFNIHRNAFCTTRLDKEYLEHKKMIDTIFGVNTINTWFCAPIFVNEQMNSLFIACISMCSDWNHRIKRNSFVESDVGIMLLMYRQLIDAIERVESRNEIEKMNNELQRVNERLKNLAVRDTLTGLYNRQGFSEELDFLADRAKRENRDKELSILYADLDNFKFYNDTFGHDIGDFILVQFATLLKQICGPDGYVVRYGGDEFIVVIHSADREYIENAAKRIYEILKEEKGFTDKISDKLGVEVNIPEEKYVSCSIGISSAIINPENSKKKIDDAIKQADEMMYYIKKTVKHRYVFYDDVEHDCK